VNRDLAERASPGVHDAAFASLREICPPPARIADLGAGTGAWSRRLANAGYEVVPVDLDRAGWGLPGLQLRDRDLNRDFAEGLGGPFDGVTSLEVLEHLENPRHFLRQCRALIGSTGILLITTPNIENVAGRIRFFLNGHFRGFDRDPSCNEPTHITPIQSYMFEKMCDAAGLAIASHEFTHPSESTTGSHKRLVFAALRPFIRGAKGGDHHLYILKSVIK
jgi:2-polyprenyl-3-methyl-5-hydroxy-6-metoxy-1,4-benzoquinol methylase